MQPTVPQQHPPFTILLPTVLNAQAVRVPHAQRLPGVLLVGWRRLTVLPATHINPATTVPHLSNIKKNPDNQPPPQKHTHTHTHCQRNHLQLFARRAREPIPQPHLLLAAILTPPTPNRTSPPPPQGGWAGWLAKWLHAPPSPVDANESEAQGGCFCCCRLLRPLIVFKPWHVQAHRRLQAHKPHTQAKAGTHMQTAGSTHKSAGCCTCCVCVQQAGTILEMPYTDLRCFNNNPGAAVATGPLAQH